MAIINFILSNWSDVLLAALAIAAIVYFAARGQLGVIRETLFALVTDAEKSFGGGTGKLKRSAVIAWIYEKLPSWLRPILTKNLLGGIIDKAVELAKPIWNTNEDIKAYIASGVEEKSNER